MLLGEGLVLEFGSVDGLAASAVSSCEITALYQTISALELVSPDHKHVRT